jgi:alpha-ketoglutarate-dependent taurine dioxygenase
LNIPPHTDGTYYEDVPGLQIFHCISGSYSGGLTSLIDGFAVAERMRAQHPDAFAVLCSVRLPFRYIGDGYHLSNRTHVFTLDDTGSVVQFRYNNCDRAPLDAATLVPVLQAAALPIAGAITYERIYDALQRLHELLDDSSMQVQFKLAPGKVMLSQRAHVFAFVSRFRIHRIS